MGGFSMSDHQCHPSEPIAVFWHTCRTCLKEIEPVFCQACDGTGHEYGSTHTMRPCVQCSGTGVIEWRPVTVDLHWPDPKKGRP